MVAENRKNVVYREILDYVMIAIGTMIYSIGWVIFLLPNHIATGGVAGLSSIIFWGAHVPVFITYFAMNAVLLAIALRVLGLKFSLKTIYGVVMITLIVAAIRAYIPHPDILTDQPFMTSIIGGAFCGMGVGFCFSFNGSTGGSDIVAAIINKYRDISLGRIILLVDMIIVTLSYVVLKDWEQVIYGYVVLFTSSFVVDQVVNSGRRSVQFLIISERYEEISRFITDTPPRRGVTLLDAHGYYSGNALKVLIVVTKQREAPLLYRMIDSIDPYAFVTQSAVMGVYGKGFDKFKVKRPAFKKQRLTYNPPSISMK